MKSLFIILIVTISTFSSCRKTVYSNIESEVIKEWRINLTSRNLVPVPPNRNDSGTLTLQIRDNRSVVYQYNISQFKDDDFIQTGGIYAGAPGANGNLLLNFNAQPSPAYGTGVLTNLRTTLIDSLMNNNVRKYVMLTSTMIPSGVVRGQLQ